MIFLHVWCMLLNLVDFHGKCVLKYSWHWSYKICHIKLFGWIVLPETNSITVHQKTGTIQMPSNHTKKPTKKGEVVTWIFQMVTLQWKTPTLENSMENFQMSFGWITFQFLIFNEKTPTGPNSNVRNSTGRRGLWETYRSTHRFDPTGSATSKGWQFHHLCEGTTTFLFPNLS